MLVQSELFFLPLVGTGITTPFVIPATGDEIFRDVLERALAKLLHGDATLRGKMVDISTASADIPVGASMLGKPVDEVVRAFGSSFCIKHGSQVVVG